ncbi:helix-turn-helix domain-containing protein [Nocardia puris]|uniref:MmyB family transcriptional regulator n=1 Tax=Nocardia puris TaxID=208602 RepID=UPI0018938E79|nr:helix-turn-helix domain-containing protein [Nocardia puris]MBF6366876.1 helix-turn-helix domain-containing protein [Nocardia puris]
MLTSPALTGMPDFHDSVEYLRHHLNLSREALAHHAGISVSYLHQLIQKRTTPGPRAFDGLVRVFDLTPAQRRHLHELIQPSADLALAADMRRHLTNLGVHAHLNHLDTRDILAAYTDPLQTVLHANRTFYRVMPGLAEAGHNIIRWMLTPAARDILDNWDDELRYFVALLRPALGRHRDLPRARTLFRNLRAHTEFRDAWDNTPMHVAYDASRPTPFSIHIPCTNQPVLLSIEIDQYNACPDICLTHGLYNTATLACPTAIAC